MPTQRQHGGAAIAHIPLTLPAFKGLNTQASRAILPPEWATKLNNTVINDSAQIAARLGWMSQTTTPASANVMTSLYEYLKYDGTSELVAQDSAAAFFRSTDDGDTWTTITGTTSNTGTSAQFANFNDVIVASTGDGEPMIRWTGAGTFADVTDSPDGTCLLSAFGRVWGSDASGTAVLYSALLDETDWTGTDAGSQDMKNIWPQGDNVVALAAFNGSLVIFGSRNIAIYTDGQGSELGIDPTQMYLADTITGTGCIARDSVVNVDGDLWFLSQNGLQSLGRLVQEKSNPIMNLSRHIQDYLKGYVDGSSASDIRAVFSPDDRFYLLSLPVGSGTLEAGRSFAFDTRGKMEDGTVRVMGEWTNLVPTAAVVKKDRTFLSAIRTALGEVGNYSGSDDDGDAYTFDYESGWLDITESQGFKIIPKRLSGIFFTEAAATVTFKWAFDFMGTFNSAQVTYSDAGAGAEFGVGEWGEDEFGGGATQRSGRVAGKGTGEFIKLGVLTPIQGAGFAVQLLDIFAKVGRLQ